MSVNLHILDIDQQRDFCRPDGALFVLGADKDAQRAAKMSRKLLPAITDWHETLDLHQRLHIAHPEFIVNRRGEHPKPITQDPSSMITFEQGRSGEFTTANPALRGMWLDYLSKLEQGGRYVYCIWPPHCLIGDTGSAVTPELREVLDEWALLHFATVDYVPKGSSWKTEHYSAVKADVEDPADPTTKTNMRFVQALEEADVLLVRGQAKSHCVANTMADVIDNLGDPSFASKIYLVEDCMSSVPGCEFLWDNFMAKYGSRINLTTSTEIVKQF